MNRAVFASLTILCLLSISSITGLIRTVKADGGSIYIRADGSIDPPTAPIYTADNITYTITGNITADADGIVIERDNMILDGAGYTVQDTRSQGGNEFKGVHLTGRSNVTIKNMNIRTFDYGIYLNGSSSNSLRGNNITNVVFGIYLDYSSSNDSVSKNEIVSNENGIYLSSASNNIVSGNNITNNGDGIMLESSPNNSINGNTITDNYEGIHLYFSSNNSINGNSIRSKDTGIFIYSSSNNGLYDNNFISNPQQVGSFDSTNVWDDGVRGNYWSDYLTKYPNATETNSSGVWNTPYVIDTNNTDRYPLMVQYVIPEFPSSLVLPLFMIATLLAIIIYKRKGVKTSQS